MPSIWYEKQLFIVGREINNLKYFRGEPWASKGNLSF